MSSPFFRFKRFTVWHDRCAMKVGTDGVLLGAWCPITVDSLQLIVNSRKHKKFRVLDIGTHASRAIYFGKERRTGE